MSELTPTERHALWTAYYACTLSKKPPKWKDCDLRTVNEHLFILQGKGYLFMGPSLARTQITLKGYKAMGLDPIPDKVIEERFNKRCQIK